MLDRRCFIALGAAGASMSMGLLPSRASAEPRTVTFPDRTRVPALGQGSWHMADGRTPPEQAQNAMRLGVSLGLTLVDTSDDYGAGRSEQMIAKVLAGQRDKIFLVSKLDPSEALSEDGVETALRASLKRLGTDVLDLYLLHQRRGADVKAAVKGLETNQVLYNLAARDIEADLMPWCAKHKMPIMAYSPLGAGGKGALLGNPVLMKVGLARGVSAATVALAWAMRDGRTIVVTETGSAKHVRENASAATLMLSDAEIKALDDAFPPPRAG